MKIFADLHHSDLYASLHYLFEDRLGFELYRPIGLDWFNLGYWKIAEPYGNDIGTVEQFLRVGSTPTDGTPSLNHAERETNGVWHIWDETRNYHQKAITLDQFRKMDFDIIIASIPAHIKSFQRLIEEQMPKAKLIYHMGNIEWENDIPWKSVNNIMASVKPFPVPEGKNVVFYRQEFDLKTFDVAEEKPKRQITSFVNLLPHQFIWDNLKKELPDYGYKAYGISCPDGIITGVDKIAGIMRESKFGFHYKPHGDGYGHIIHNWMAIGRPVIVNLDDYKDKLAGELLIDGFTCIDISNKSVDEVARIISNMSDLEYYDMCRNVKSQFRETVNFEQDAQKVKRFLDGLV